MARRRLGGLAIIGLLARDRVDGGPLRVGGAAYYGARALAHLGETALIATKYADIDEGLAAPLHRLGLEVVRGTVPATASFEITNDGDSRRMVLEEPGEPWTLEDLSGWLREPLARVEWVHAGALSRADFPDTTLARLGHHRVVLLDGQALTRSGHPGPVELDDDFDRGLLAHVRILKLSLEEAEALDLDLSESALRSLGIPEVVVTLASRGSVVYSDGVAEHVPTSPLEVSDSTGAGDAFAASYLAARRRGEAPASAARCASDIVATLLSLR